MPTVTVLAPDSTLAMDEVIRQLGDNAYILATHARDGQVEILATNEPNQIQPPRKRTTSVSFADALFEQGLPISATAPMFKSVRQMPLTMESPRTDPGQTDDAKVVDMQTARARLSDTMPVAALEPEHLTIGQATTEAVAHRPGAGEAIGTSPRRILPMSGPLDISPSDLYDRSTPVSSQGTPLGRTDDPVQSDPTKLAPPPAIGEDSADLGLLLQELGATLARLEARVSPQSHQESAKADPLTTAGFSGEIIKRLAPDAAVPARAAQFVAAMAKTLICHDPVAGLRTPVVVIVGPSGAGKTILAGKVAALTVDIRENCEVELVSLSETPRFANSALPIYARMLSVPHRTLHCDQLDAGRWLTTGCTYILDTNVEADVMTRTLKDLRAEIGHDAVSVLIALPLGSSLGKIKAELEKYQDFNAMIVLTKLDECELTPQEASQIAETGTQIAWLSGTRALTETLAPASEEMMTEFLTGLLTVRS